MINFIIFKMVEKNRFSRQKIYTILTDVQFNLRSVFLYILFNCIPIFNIADCFIFFMFAKLFQQIGMKTLHIIKMRCTLLFHHRMIFQISCRFNHNTFWNAIYLYQFRINLHCFIQCTDNRSGNRNNRLSIFYQKLNIQLSTIFSELLFVFIGREIIVNTIFIYSITDSSHLFINKSAGIVFKQKFHKAVPIRIHRLFHDKFF